METKNTFLKIMSIIILIGGIAFIVLALALFGLAALSGLAPELATIKVLLIVAGILMLIGGIFEIIAGRTGLKASKDPSKSKACVVLGIILMIPSILAFIFVVVSLNILAGLGGLDIGISYGNAISSLLIGVVVPLLYIVAAKIGVKSVA